jgi:hypothetical protein
MILPDLVKDFDGKGGKKHTSILFYMLLWCLAPLAICLLLLHCEKLHTQTQIDRATSSSFTCCCSRLLNTKETVTIVQPIVSFVQDKKKFPLDFLFGVIKAWCETCWKNPLSNNVWFQKSFPQNLTTLLLSFTKILCMSRTGFLFFVLPSDENATKR